MFTKDNSNGEIEDLLCTYTASVTSAVLISMDFPAYIISLNLTISHCRNTYYPISQRRNLRLRECHLLGVC